MIPIRTRKLVSDLIMRGIDKSEEMVYKDPPSWEEAKTIFHDNVMESLEEYLVIEDEVAEFDGDIAFEFDEEIDEEDEDN